MLDFFPKTTPGDIFRKFMIYFPVGLVAALLVFWMIARLESKQVSLLEANHERSHLLQVQNVLGRKLAMLAADLMTLAESASLKIHLESPAPSNIKALADRLHIFAEDNGNYDLVAYLDQTGRELAGIDRRPQVPADDRRQDQYRDHVRETLALGRGSVAVSVSVGGQAASVDSPFLHLSTPVFDRYGVRRGMVMIGCRTDRVVDQAMGLFPERDSDRFMVVDSNGHSLRGPAPGQEKSGLFHAIDQPDLWRAVQNSPEGQIRSAGGWFSFASLIPVQEIRKAVGAEPESGMQDDPGHDVRQRPAQYAWHVLSYTPVRELSSLDTFRARFWFIPLGIAALAAGSLHLAINRANKERSDRAVELLSTAIEQSPAAAVITDRSGLIRYANPKFLAMSGYVREEIVGQNPRIFKSGETPDDVYRNLWQTILAGRVWTGEFRNKRKDQSHYIVSAKISPILLKSGGISGYLAIQEDITETRRMQRQLERLATIDGLTGIYNRSHFLHLFSQELRREERYGQPLCLLVFDLDHFKAINDSYGHQAGDRVLEEFARVVGSALRDTDIFGRLGGEEFGVVLLQTDHDGARLLADRLRAAIENMQVSCASGIIRVTVSIGGTQWERKDHTIEIIINRADSALYEAKRKGRNQVCFRFSAEDGNRN